MSQFLDAQKFSSLLTEDLQRCSRVHAAVSYVRQSGVVAIDDLTPSQTEHSCIITCTDFGLTEPEALNALLSKGFRVRVAISSGLHAKVWLIYFQDRDPVLYVGSSNLSFAAHSTNHEANLRTSDRMAIDEASQWLGVMSDSDFSCEIDQAWVDNYRDVRPEPPRPSKINIAKVTAGSKIRPPSGPWLTRTGGITFLSQGILEGVTQAAPSREELLARTRVFAKVNIVLFANKGGQLSVYKEYSSTLNSTGGRNVQLGVGRKVVKQWIQYVWNLDLQNFDRQGKSFNDWFELTGRSMTDFQYEICITLDESLPTIWAKPST